MATYLPARPENGSAGGGGFGHLDVPLRPPYGGKMNTKIGLYIALMAMLAVGGCVFIVSDEADAVDGTAKFTVGGETGEWADVKDNVTDGCTITVASSGVFTNSISISATDVILNLNGHIITFAPVDTSKAYSAIIINEGGSLSIVDNGSVKGAITTNQNEILINNWGTTVVDGVSMELNYSGAIDKMIQNTADLSFKNSVIVCHSTEKYEDNAIVNFKDLVLENVRVESDSTAVYNGYNGFGNVSCNIVDSNIVSLAYGVGVFGKGITDGSELDNNSAVVEIENSSITITGNGQGIATNASGGANAGHTVTLRNVTIDASKDGCGIYAPSLGVYNIIGGRILGGDQAIRISAGELNISGGAVIESTSESSVEDGLVSGGSGGAGGALVIGKAGAGYVGGIDVNIDNAQIINSNGDAVVMSDVYMGTTYKDVEINFNFNSGTITGDIQNITSSTYSLEGNPITSEDAKPASGNAHFKLNGGEVYGNVHQSSGGANLTIGGSFINGDVRQSDGSQAVTVQGGMITGSVPESVRPSGIVTFVIMGESVSIDYFGDSITLPYYGAEPGYTVGWSTDNKTITYEDGQRITGLSGNITLYFMIVSDEDQGSDNPPYPWWDDDDDYVPPVVPVQPEDSGDDDTVTIVACAAAAVVAALLAAFLIIDRRQ